MTLSAWLAAHPEAPTFAPTAGAFASRADALTDRLNDLDTFRFGSDEDDGTDTPDSDTPDSAPTQLRETATTAEADTGMTWADMRIEWLTQQDADAASRWTNGRPERPERPERYPGLEEVTIDNNGDARTVIIDVPASYDPADTTTTYSAVLIFHGSGGNASNMVRIGFSDAGEEEEFIAVYLNAADTKWSSGRNEDDPDDLGFVTATIDALVADWNVDADSLFAVGHSNGGMFVQRLAHEMPEVFSGYGVVNANMPSTMDDPVVNEVDEPMVFFHGTEDEQMPYEGWTLPRGDTVFGAEDTIDFWTAENDTQMGDYTALPDTADDGMTTTYSVSDDGTIAHYVTEGGGHAWPGLDRWNDRTGEPTRDIDATDIIVDFFSDFGL